MVWPPGHRYSVRMNPNATETHPRRAIRERRLRAEWVPGIVLVGALAFTAVATAGAAASAADRDDARFRNAVESAADRITGRLDVYIATLRAGAALFAASEAVTAAEFNTFVERLEIQERYPGIQGIGWSPRLAADTSGGEAEQYEIRYLQPDDDRNRAALGYDMYGEAVRREAMQRARDLGDPALSGRVTLVQEITPDRQAGFLIYVPVYRGGAVPRTEAERRRLLTGFVYSPFRAEDLFRGVFGSEAEPRVSFAVYDGVVVDEAALLYAGAETGHEPRHTTTRSMPVAGRTWTVVFQSEPGFEAASGSGLVPSLGLGGLLASVLLYWLATRQAAARAEAEMANRAKSAFLAHMSHELRTPLNAIGGYVDLMLMGIPGPITETQEEYLHRVNGAHSHLLGLINDVLNYAKLEAGGVRLTREPVSVADGVTETALMVSGLAETKGVALDVEPGPQAHVWGDEEKIRQILLNLLSNAVKFTPGGGTVTVGWTATGDEVWIQVTDTGTGIPADRQEAIFEPFVQVETDPPGVRQGTGLGLSIARSLARGMDGDVVVKSQPGAGSTFTLTLPQAVR
ncbi:MAG TPA: CHASE domain-containing protein [Longimicrobiales bacterium]|nr:CHASE domain-containing protein [Longimicrobiales bacterium]